MCCRVAREDGGKFCKFFFAKHENTFNDAVHPSCQTCLFRTYLSIHVPLSGDKDHFLPKSAVKLSGPPIAYGGVLWRLDYKDSVCVYIREEV